MEEDRLILLDTNVFLEFLMDRKGAEDCEKLLSRISKGEVQGVATRFSLHSVEAVYKSDYLRDFLGNIDRSLGLTVRETTTLEERGVAALAKELKLDFDDAMQYFVAGSMGVDSIVSYDRHFDGLGIPRVEPGDLD